VLALVSVRCLVKVSDPDVFWHVRTGELIAAAWRVPRIDPFSHTANGPWTYMEVLAEILFWGAHRIAGIAGLQILTMMVVTALGCLVAHRVRSAVPSTTALAITLLLWGASSALRFGPKTELFSLLAMAALLVVLDAVERTGRAGWLTAVPLIMLGWANLHRGGVLGIGLLGLAAVAWAVQRRGLVAALAMAAVVGVLALLLNPAGFGYLRAAFDLSSRASFARHLPEWASPSPRFFLQFGQVYIAMLVLWAADLRYGRTRLRETLFALATVSLGFWGVRFIPFAAVAIAPAVARTIQRILEFATQRLDRWVRPSLVVGAAWVLPFAIVVTHSAVSVPLGAWGLGVAWNVPARCAAFLAKYPPPGRMWNHFNFGGYFVYALAPAQKVFIDGRNDTVYSDAFFDETARAVSDPQALFDQLERYRIGYVVVLCSNLTELRPASLVGHPAWQIVYMDDVAAVFVRRGPDTAAYRAQHGYLELSPADGLERAMAPRSSDPRREQFEAEVDRLVAEAPESVRAHLLASYTAEQRGQSADAVTHRDIALSLARQRWDLGPE
jgi:hypothetical protein